MFIIVGSNNQYPELHWESHVSLLCATRETTQTVNDAISVCKVAWTLTWINERGSVAIREATGVMILNHCDIGIIRPSISLKTYCTSYYDNGIIGPSISLKTNCNSNYDIGIVGPSISFKTYCTSYCDIGIIRPSISLKTYCTSLRSYTVVIHARYICIMTIDVSVGEVRGWYEVRYGICRSGLLDQCTRETLSLEAYGVFQIGTIT